MEDAYPVVEAQQDGQQQAVDSVLVKLQLELQQQLRPHTGASGDDTARGDDTLVTARLTPVDGAAAARGAPAAAAEESAEQLAATAAAVAEATASSSIASLAASPFSVTQLAQPAEPAVDAAAAAAAAAAATPALAPGPAAAATTTSATPSSTPSAGAAGHGAAAASPAHTAAHTPRPGSERCLSGAEEDWQLVSRGTSARGTSSTGRCSFEEAAATGGSASPFGPTDLSECGSDATPRDELAASILGHPVMMAAHAQQAAHDAAGAGAGDGSASSGGVTLHASEAAPPALPEAAAAAAAAPGARGQGGAAAGSSDALVPVVGAGEAISLLSGGLLQLAGAAQARATEGFEGLRDWLVESLAALVQSGRMSHATCMARVQALVAQVQAAAKQQDGLAAAAVHAAGDWRWLLSSAAAVVCLAMWMRSRKEAAVLRTMLRRRDHELSKLVMRVVSLQELINQGGHLQPIGRYARFEGAAVSSATFM